MRTALTFFFIFLLAAPFFVYSTNDTDNHSDYEARGSSASSAANNRLQDAVEPSEVAKKTAELPSVSGDTGVHLVDGDTNLPVDFHEEDEVVRVVVDGSNELGGLQRDETAGEATELPVESTTLPQETTNAPEADSSDSTTSATTAADSRPLDFALLNDTQAAEFPQPAPIAGKIVAISRAVRLDPAASSSSPIETEELIARIERDFATDETNATFAAALLDEDANSSLTPDDQPLDRANQTASERKTTKNLVVSSVSLPHHSATTESPASEATTVMERETTAESTSATEKKQERDENKAIKE